MALGLLLFGQIVALPLLLAPAHSADDLHAASAEEASTRFDLNFNYTEIADIDQGDIEARLTGTFARSHQVLVVAQLIDANLDENPGLSGGDIEIGYSYAPGITLNSNPWVPSKIGNGIGISIPAGDLEDGTGTGGWRLSPRLGFVKTVDNRFSVAPSAQYIFSFAEESGADKIRLLALTMPITLVSTASVWLQWTPEYAYSFESDSGAFGGVFTVGKLFTRHIALSAAYAYQSILPDSNGDRPSNHANVWTVSLHFPFGYTN
jgi:hypothetical protein